MANAVHPSNPKALTVALVGRPNTGKSTLFNRLTKSRLAIVSSVPGTTRDRREGRGHLAGLPLRVVDTGGLDDRGAVSVHIQEQVERALQDADIVLFMVDAKTGITALDLHFAKWLRKRRAADDKDVIVLANKTEGAHSSPNVMDTISESLRLGFGEPLAISASHGDGMADLAVVLLEQARLRGFSDGEEKEEKEEKVGGVEGEEQEAPPTVLAIEDRTIQLAVMGRPNVGKSTLINAFVGQERVITGPTPGLTRDAIHVEWEYRGRDFRLVDTAGLTRLRPDKALLSAAEENKRQKIVESVGAARQQVPAGTRTSKAVTLPGIDLMNPEEDPSQYSYQVSEMALMSALNALRFAQVVLLVVDGEQGKFSNVDMQLARKCLEEGRALVIAANKKDLVLGRGVSATAYEEGVREHSQEFFREFGDVPVISCCALAANGTRRILETVVAVHDAWSKRVPTWVLNKWVKDATLTQGAAPRAGGKSIKLKYLTQVKTRPPTFALFCNTDELPGFYSRFLRSRLQKDFQLEGVPVRFEVRKTQGAAVKEGLLRQGKHTRRGVGHGEGRGVGPANRDSPGEMHRRRTQTDERRRRDTRIGRQRRSGSS